LQVLKVAHTTNPNKLAGAIANIVRGGETAELDCRGAGAVNQAAKGIAVARGYVSPNGIDLVAIPAFGETKENDQEITLLKFIVEPR
jgi:stage V sporulation protein S